MVDLGIHAAQGNTMKRTSRERRTEVDCRDSRVRHEDDGVREDNDGHHDKDHRDCGMLLIRGICPTSLDVWKERVDGMMWLLNSFAVLICGMQMRSFKCFSEGIFGFRMQKTC